MINFAESMETSPPETMKYPEEYHGAFTSVHPPMITNELHSGYSHFSLTTSLSAPPKVQNYKLNSKMNDYLNSPIGSAADVDAFTGKNSENSRRFSVNNLLQLASCTSRNISGYLIFFYILCELI